MIMMTKTNMPKCDFCTIAGVLSATFMAIVAIGMIYLMVVAPKDFWLWLAYEFAALGCLAATIIKTRKQLKLYNERQGNG